MTKRINAILTKTTKLPLILSGKALSKGRCKRLNILLSSSQRRNRKHKNTQAIIKVISKISFFDLLMQITVCRCKNADIYRENTATTDASHLFFLQYSQQTRLQCQRHLSDLVKKNRTAMRHFENTCFPLRASSGKCTFLIAKQLALQQRFRKRRTVNCNKRIVPTFAVVMDALCKELLANAGFPVEHNGTVYLCIDARTLFYCTDCRTGTKNIRKFTAGNIAAAHSLDAQFIFNGLNLFAHLDIQHGANDVAVKQDWITADN